MLRVRVDWDPGAGAQNCIQSLGGPTWHVHHAAVAVLHQVARLTVNAAGGDAVGVEEIRVHGNSFAGAPGWGQVDELPGEPGSWGSVGTSPRNRSAGLF